MSRVFRICKITKPRGPISRSTLYAHAAAGRITLRKIGGTTVVAEADWAAYLVGEPVIHSTHRNHAA